MGVVLPDFLDFLLLFNELLCFDFVVVELFVAVFFLVVVLVVCGFLFREMDCASPESGNKANKAINRKDNIKVLFFILIVICSTLQK